MTVLSQSFARLSMLSLCAAALLPIAPAAAAGPATSAYFGRWTVNEDKPVFSARGRLYRTIDVAPCGRDFCGVSVDERGACGPLLFRFLAAHASAVALRGHGRWGDQQKNLEIYRYDGDPDTGSVFELYLGDGHNFGGRSSNMPKFSAAYRRAGEARCKTR